MSAQGIHAWETFEQRENDGTIVVTSTCSKCQATKTFHVDERGNLLDPNQPNPLGGCPQ